MTNTPEDNKQKDKDLVQIQINEPYFSITKGNHTIVEIKQLGGVPLADDLVEIKEKKPLPLKDDGHTNINGGEKFVSHPKGSGSSHR